MGETLTKRHRVNDEGRKIVKFFSGGKILMVPQESAPANSVPAAAVRRRVQALSGIIGCKVSLGGFLSRASKPEAQLQSGARYWKTRDLERQVEFCV